MVIFHSKLFVYQGVCILSYPQDVLLRWIPLSLGCFRSCQLTLIHINLSQLILNITWTSSEKNQMMRQIHTHVYVYIYIYIVNHMYLGKLQYFRSESCGHKRRWFQRCWWKTKQTLISRAPPQWGRESIYPQTINAKRQWISGECHDDSHYGCKDQSYT